jgi:two-component system CheB/CheR fusion protein
MDFSWQERGGPPVEPASHQGFGLSLINAMGSTPTAEPAIDFTPSGFACRIRVPLNTISPNRYDRLSATLVPGTSAWETATS